FAGAVAMRTRPGNAEETLSHSHLARAAALCAGLRIRTFCGSAAGALAAGLHAMEANTLLHAKRRFPQGHFQRVFEIVACLCASTAPATAGPAEERVEYVVKRRCAALETAKTTKTARADTGRAKLIVLG